MTIRGLPRIDGASGERKLGFVTYEHSVDSTPNEANDRAANDRVVRPTALDQFGHLLRSVLFS